MRGVYSRAGMSQRVGIKKFRLLHNDAITDIMYSPMGTFICHMIAAEDAFQRDAPGAGESDY